MKMAKRVLAVVMVLVTLVSFMGIAAEAASLTVNELNLGYMVPTNSKGTKTLETVRLYGDYDYINFYINSKKSNSYFAYEIYSDKNYTNLVESNAVNCDKGTYTYTPTIKLKGNYSSKTYYLFTYAAKVYSDGSIDVDQNSMCQFKLVVKRSAAFDDKIVILKETKNTTKGAYIKWSKLSGASKYYIYRRSITGTKWTKVGGVGSSKVSFTDTSVKDKNANYIYSVKGINKAGTASRYLYSGLTCLYAKTPTMKSIAVTYNNAIEIKWNSTSSKAKYNIMRKEGDGSWKTIKTSYSGTSYKDTSVKSGKVYTYSVKAVISTDYGKATSSYYTNSSKAVTYLRAPTLKDVLAVENGVDISWYPVTGSEGYTILRKNSDGSTGWSSVGKVGADATNFVDTTVTIDTDYIYSVRSEAANNKGSYNRTGIEYIVLKKPVISVERAEESNQVVISWESVPKANSYEIYYRPTDGEWQKLTSTSDLSYKYYLNEFGDFEYKVRAVKNNEFFSEYSDAVSYTHIPYVSFTYVAYNDGIEMTWLDYGADGYSIYRKLSGSTDDEYVLIASVTDNKYKDTSVEEDISYTYQIRLVHNGTEQTEYLKGYAAGILTEGALQAPPQIQTRYDTIWFETDAVIYGYNFKEDCWESIDFFDENPREYYDAYLNDGKYRFAFFYYENGMKTPIDNSLIDYEWYDKKVDYSAKLKDNVVTVTFPGVGEEVEKYVVSVRSETRTIFADGSDTYKVEFERTSSWAAKEDIYIEVFTKNGDISLTTGYINFGVQ